MATLSIRRLANRVVAPDAQTAWAAAPVLDSAARRLPAILDRVLAQAEAMAGLPPDAAVALRRLEVRLTFREDPDRLSEDWAAAIAAMLGEAISAAVGAQAVAADSTGAMALPPPGLDNGEAAVFADGWEAEAAILRRFLAAGLPLPWWAESLSPGTPDAARLLGEWVERDPARAAVYLLDLLRDGAPVARLLSPAAARRLAGRLLQRLAMGTPAARTATAGQEWENSAWAETWAGVPGWLGAMLGAVPADRRALFNLAALMVHVPAATLFLARFGRSLARVGEALAAVTALPAEGASPTSRAPRAEPAQLAGLTVMNGGLLLLLRPLLELGVVTAVPPREGTATLLGIGLLALQRVAAPLPPAARHVLLERDRPLLAAFAGADPPDAPLANQTAPPEAAGHLDLVLAAAPPRIDWAPDALRRYYGGPDPFGDAPEGRLARLLLRPGRLALTRWSVDITWPLATADIALRRAGWDIDPGWLPWIGRTVRFRYDGTGAT